MRFLLDVHISTGIARALEDAGHEVVRAALVYPRWSDAALLGLAVEKDWIMVTEDSDFTDLIYANGHPAPRSLIYIRCEPEEQRAMAGRVLEILDDERLPGHIVVITAGHAQFRAFPRTEQINGRI